MPKAPKSAPVAKSKGKAPSKSSQPKLYSSFLPIELVLPVPPLASSSKAPAQVSHYIYVRPHTSNSSTSNDHGHPSDRTVFVANVPVDATERDLRVLFGKWGVVESVDFTGRADTNALESAVMGLEQDEISDEDEDEESASKADDGNAEQEDGDRPEPTFVGNGAKLPRRLRSRRKPTLPASVPDLVPLPPLDPRSTPYGPSGSRCAHIVLLDASPLKRLMSHNGPIHLPSYGLSTSTKSADPTNPTGLEYYISQYASLRPSLSAVKDFADSSMARFDHLHSLLLKSRAKNQGAGALVDEDGFTVVVRGGRYGRTGGRGPGSAGVAVASKGFAKTTAPEGKEGKRKGSGAKPMDDFYRFQKTDRKRQGESVWRILSWLSSTIEG